MSRTDVHFMNRALTLAARGAGRVSPNPLVGSVVVSRGRIVGEGYHARYGGPHAEAVALRRAGRKARGATLYVNLEPCAHQGHTPPCTDAIINAGVRQVVYAMRDPHHRVNGRGCRQLRRAHVGVRQGALAAEARALNTPFVTRETKRRPYVTVKMAQTLDGKIATVTRQSRWITSSRARRHVHQLRKSTDAILIGIETALVDNPRLGVRADGQPSTRDPVKVIVDNQLRLPVRSHLVRTAACARVVVATTQRAPAKRRAALTRYGVRVQIFPARRGCVDLRAVCRWLAQQGINQLLVEGGGEIVASLLSDRLVDHAVWFVAPKIVGGRTAPTTVGGVGIPNLNRAIRVINTTTQQLGPDVCIRGDLKYV